MDVFAAAERLMRMDDAAWARHASPWSVWTRFSILPLLVGTVWARIWLGWWVILPLSLVVVWIWVNPFAFPPPDRTDTWAAKATFGERVWLNRKAVPVPAHHAAWARGLSAAAGIGLLPLVWGVAVLDAGWTLAGLILTMGAKIWFCDRMVWLYDDMKDTEPAYRSWLRP